MSKNLSLFFEFIRKGLRKITRLFIVFRTDDVVRLNLHDFVLTSSLIADCLSSIVQMEADELVSIAACFGEERALKIHERLATSQCFVLYNDSNMVGWAWATALPRPREGDKGFFYPVVPLSEHVYLYDVYILPHARGKGLGYKLIACSCMKLAEQGYNFVFFTHDHENIAMNRITWLLNFEKLGELYYRRILWHKFIDITALNFVCNPSEKI